MEIKDILKMFERLNSDKISFLYHGFLYDEFTDTILDLFEKNIIVNSDATFINNKISFLVSESLRNIVRHGEIDISKETFGSKSGFFILRNLNNVFYIFSANLINNKNIEALKNKLLLVNELDRGKLKSFQNEIMNNSVFTAKGGAGLGLIQMASKSGNKFAFDFEKVNDEYSYFYFQIRVQSELQDDYTPSEFNITSLKELHLSMEMNNSHLTYKGSFSQENVLLLLKLIERNVEVYSLEHLGTKNTLYKILTELLQNICKHAFTVNNKPEGIFMLGKSLNKYVISTGNFIENSMYEDLLKKIKYLNDLDKDNLKAIYLDKIKNSDTDSDGNAGLGLIEIARECSEKIEYSVSEINEIYSFLTISINI